MDETDKGNGAAGKLCHGIRLSEGNEAVADARLLFKECASSLGFDLSLRDFAHEVAELPGEYVSPTGALLVALCDGQPCGCVAMRPLEAGVCEMKRLHVRHTCRGKGLGRRLVDAVAWIARESGYNAMRVNTLPWMRDAIAGYRSLGFEPLPPHRNNPIAGTQSLELALTGYQPHHPRVVALRPPIERQPLGGHGRGQMKVPGASGYFAF